MTLESAVAGTDFIEECGPQTLKLRDCVDAHQEYYSVLNETPAGESSESESMQ